MSFITAFWKAGMEPAEHREAKMRQRVAMSAIYGQRAHEEIYETTNRPLWNPNEEPRISDKPMYIAAHSDTKHLPNGAGMRGTLASGLHYVGQAQATRDALLKEAADEAAAES